MTRSRLPLEIHHAVFGFILEIADWHDLVKGKRIGVDASTREANAALRRLVRRDSGEDYPEASVQRLGGAGYSQLFEADAHPCSETALAACTPNLWTLPMP